MTHGVAQKLYPFFFSFSFSFLMFLLTRFVLNGDTRTFGRWKTYLFIRIPTGFRSRLKTWV